MVDALGNALYFLLTGGQCHDGVQAFDLLKGIDLQNVNVIGDRAYNATELRQHIVDRGGSYTIPPRMNFKDPWETDWWLFKERHLIECFFNKLKHFRHLSTRFDKLAVSFLAFIQIGAIFLLTK